MLDRFVMLDTLDVATGPLGMGPEEFHHIFPVSQFLSEFPEFANGLEMAVLRAEVAYFGSACHPAGWGPPQLLLSAESLAHAGGPDEALGGLRFLVCLGPAEVACVGRWGGGEGYPSALTFLLSR